MQPLGANQSWFTFSVGPVSYAVYAFTGTERVNAPFEFQIEFLSGNSSLPTEGFLGSEGLLSITDRSGKARLVHGIIRQIRQLHTGNYFTHYQCVLVPRLWFLKETVNHRIFQSKTVEQIIDEVLKTQRFVVGSYEFRIGKGYPVREYCTQYGESDLHFISRLCEEEGIIFSFEHTKTKHCLVFTDTAGGPAISGESNIRFFPGSGSVPDEPAITRITHQQRINSDVATYREWNPLTPKADLMVRKDEPSWHKAPAPVAMRMESYRFPHLYQDKKDGERYARIQLERQLVFREWIEGATDVSRMTPGRVFGMREHPRKALNRRWWLYEVVHEGEQPGVLEHEAPEDRGLRYTATFAAIPEETRFVPALEHEKRRVDGVQSALVVGQKGEEIDVDNYGRVKVLFHWDRRDKDDETASCRIRVAQGWSGNGYGTFAIPRIGSEVLVSFIDGNPDRPIITGRVYHAMMTIPDELPSDKTKTILRSKSSPGGGGFNEISVEDKKGREEIYVRAERDLNIQVKNDWNDLVLDDRQSLTRKDVFLGILGETHAYYKKIRKTELGADDHLTIHADRHEQIDKRWLASVGKEVHIKAGTKIVLEAGTEITIKAGNSFVKLDPSGVHIKGKRIDLNSGGSPGKGSGAAPQLPKQKTDTMPQAPKLDTWRQKRKNPPLSPKEKPPFTPKAEAARAQTLRNAQKAAQPLASDCANCSGGKK